MSATDVVASGAAAAPETMAEKNAKHFDKVVPDDWPQWVKDLHGQIVDFLGSPEFPSWVGLEPADASSRRMLDYACGDGVISATLRPHFGTLVGIDVSGRMLDKYRERAEALGLAASGAMVCARGDLLADDVRPTEPPIAPDERLWGFDLVVTSMALHHFADPPAAVRRLAARLRPGGVLLVIDWTPVDGSTPAQREHQAATTAADLEAAERRVKDHASRHTISKPDGFTRDEMQDLFEKAGCGTLRWRLAEELTPIPVVDVKSQLFFAAATKVA